MHTYRTRYCYPMPLVRRVLTHTYGRKGTKPANSRPTDPPRQKKAYVFFGEGSANGARIRESGAFPAEGMCKDPPYEMHGITIATETTWIRGHFETTLIRGKLKKLRS
jgi:hypothetical protein